VPRTGVAAGAGRLGCTGSGGGSVVATGGHGASVSHGELGVSATCCSVHELPPCGVAVTVKSGYGNGTMKAHRASPGSMLPSGSE